MGYDLSVGVHGARRNGALSANVLALNRLYVAVQVLSVKRAVCLLWKGIAEVVNVEGSNYMSYDFDSWREISELKSEVGDQDDDDDWIHAVTFPLQVPRVIRLLSYDRYPRSTVKFNRRNIFLRDGNQCQYCGRRFSSSLLSLDHVLPKSRGGQDTWENIVCACLRCNVRKGGRTPTEAGMSLYRTPFKPAANPVLALRLSSRKYASWKRFLREMNLEPELAE